MSTAICVLGCELDTSVSTKPSAASVTSITITSAPSTVCSVKGNGTYTKQIDFTIVWTGTGAPNPFTSKGSLDADITKAGSKKQMFISKNATAQVSIGWTDNTNPQSPIPCSGTITVTVKKTGQGETDVVEAT